VSKWPCPRRDGPCAVGVAPEHRAFAPAIRHHRGT
jgi:hypothetical protein